MYMYIIHAYPDMHKGYPDMHKRYPDMHKGYPDMYKGYPHLNLHLKMSLEGGEEREEGGEGQLKHLWYTGYTILGQGHTQILLDGCDKHLERKREGWDTGVGRKVHVQCREEVHVGIEGST